MPRGKRQLVSIGLAMFLLVHAFVIAAGQEHWPFSPYPMFSRIEEPTTLRRFWPVGVPAQSTTRRSLSNSDSPATTHETQAPRSPAHPAEEDGEGQTDPSAAAQGRNIDHAQRSPPPEPIVLAATRYVAPFNPVRLHASLSRLSRSDASRELWNRVAADLLQRYERRRRLGRHDGPELRSLRIVEFEWEILPDASNLDAPKRRRVWGEAIRSAPSDSPSNATPPAPSSSASAWKPPTDSSSTWRSGSKADEKVRRGLGGDRDVRRARAAPAPQAIPRLILTRRRSPPGQNSRDAGDDYRCSGLRAEPSPDVP